VKTISTLLLLTLILGACSPNIATPQALPAQTFTDTPVPPPTLTPVPDDTQCGYQWAYQDLPDLTEQFDEIVQTLIPNSISHATAFGENCVAADGQVVRFAAMETDFYVLATVETLDDYETFGNWIYDVMQIVDGFPPEVLAGPQLGFVEFRFEKSASESIGFRVPIQGYSETAGGKSGEELFRLYYTNP
jgi:hypothetical protein